MARCVVVAALLAATLTAGCDGSGSERPGRAGRPRRQHGVLELAARAGVEPGLAVERPDPRPGARGRGARPAQRRRRLPRHRGHQLRDDRRADHRRDQGAASDVQDVMPIALAQVVVQNRALQVAAVDPATYRNYTTLGVAESQDIWDRVADGELAIDKPLVKRLPVDEQRVRRPGQHRRRAGGPHRRVRAAGAAGRRRRQRDLDPGPRHDAAATPCSSAPAAPRPSTLRKPIEQVLAGHRARRCR